MQQNCPYGYTRNIIVYLRIQYELRHVLYTVRKLWNTAFYWYLTQVSSINSTKDIAVLGLGLGWWGWFWKTLYVHIPKETCTNGLAPKSKLMAYLGHTKGIKVFKFMHLSNNTIYHSTTMLFDETLFPKCSMLGKKRGNIRIGKLWASQLPIEPVKDTTPGDYNLPTPHTPKWEELVLD